MNVKSLRFLVFSLLFFSLCEAAARLVKTSRCSKCPPGWGVVKRCTKHQDTFCKQCERGKTYSTHHSLNGPCWLCSRCGVGLYEARKCSPHRDTVCNECTSFIDHENFTRKNDFSVKCSYLFLKNSSRTEKDFK